MYSLIFADQFTSDEVFLRELSFILPGVFSNFQFAVRVTCILHTRLHALGEYSIFDTHFG